MHKVSVIGIDNSGKTSIVRSLDNIDGVSTIHVTKPHHEESIIAHVSSNVADRLARFGEARSMRSVAGFAYLMHLFPYFIEERTRKRAKVLVSDRDTLVDTLCYADFYLPNAVSRGVRPVLKYVLEHSFGYPHSFCYLDVSPEVSASRASLRKTQLHEKVTHLARLKELFDAELHNAERRGVRVNRIKTDGMPLEEVTRQVHTYVRSLL